MIFEVQAHQCCVRGDDHFPSPAGHLLKAKTTSDKYVGPEVPSLTGKCGGGGELEANTHFLTFSNLLTGKKEFSKKDISKPEGVGFT